MDEPDKQPSAPPPGTPATPSVADAREGLPTGHFHQMTEQELAARNRRNLATAFGVVVFIVLIFCTTYFRLVQNTGGAAG